MCWRNQPRFSLDVCSNSRRKTSNREAKEYDEWNLKKNLNDFLFRFKKDHQDKGESEAKIIEDFNSFLAYMHGQRTMAKVNREM